jgi:hypothetical protein
MPGYAGNVHPLQPGMSVPTMPGSLPGGHFANNIHPIPAGGSNGPNAIHARVPRIRPAFPVAASGVASPPGYAGNVRPVAPRSTPYPVDFPRGGSVPPMVAPGSATGIHPILAGGNAPQIMPTYAAGVHPVLPRNAGFLPRTHFAAN